MTERISAEDGWTAAHVSPLAHREVFNPFGTSHLREQVWPSRFFTLGFSQRTARRLSSASTSHFCCPTWLAVFILHAGRGGLVWCEEASALHFLSQVSERSATTPSVNYSLSMFCSSKPSRAPARPRPHRASH